MKIVGGTSSPKRISIISDQFISTAHFDGKDVHCEVESISGLRAFLARTKVPMPETLRTALFLLTGAPWLVWFGIALYAALTAYLALFTEAKEQSLSGVLTGALSGIFISIVVIWVLAARVSRWHGAEHMVLAAYEKHESTDLDVIAAQERVDDGCTGRLILPVLLATTVTTAVGRLYGFHSWWLSLLAVEAVLQLDRHVGFHRVPVLRGLNRWLQVEVTTAPPTVIELETAQYAMECLLEEHGEIEFVDVDETEAPNSERPPEISPA